MSNNHLIIGIGGTGGKIIKALRKAMYEEFRNVDPTPRNGGDNAVCVDYLYIDSSKRDLDDSESWRTQGDVGMLIALNKRQQLSVVYGDLQTRLRDREHYPITHRYIGDRELWTDIFSQMNVQEAAGGQMRRLGIALFEPHCQSFVERVTTACNELSQASGVQGTSFHVCCGLAGGTGSGAFPQIIAQLRATFPSDRDYPIYLYLLLPDRDSDWASNGERTNYYANGYAALQELNAYLLSDPGEGPNKGGPQFAPLDLTGRSLRFENLATGGRTRLLGRVQGCFVLSNVNEQKLIIGVKNEEIHGLLAQMIFQRVFLIDSAETGQYRGLRDAITLENTAVDDEALATDPNTKVRSVRFLTFGIKRLIVPEEEIREHFSANFASQTALQMLYNNWPAETGSNAFLGEKKNTSFKLFVQKEEPRALWKLSDEHITLSQGILATEINNPRWRPVSEDWQEVTPHLKEDAWALPWEGGRDPRLDELEKLFQERYGDTFRGIGVEKFYETAQRDLRLPDRHIAEIIDNLERWLFECWLEGSYGISELDVLVTDLVEDLEQRLGAIPARLENLKEQMDHLIAKLDANNERWARVGLIARLLKRPANIFDAQAEILTALYEKRTWHQAWSFADRLLRLLIAELRDRLRPEIAEFRLGLVNVNDFFRKRIDQTCQDNPGQRVETTNVIKFYEPDKVRRFCRSLLEMEQQQRSWAGRLRREAVRTAEENKRRNGQREKYFAMLVAHFTKTPDAVRVFEDISRQNMEQAHSEHRIDSISRYFGVNIVSKLAGQYTDSEKLKNYIKDLVQSSLTFMQWRPVEFNGTPGPTSILAVVLPKCEEHNVFREQLKQEFRNHFSDKVEIIDSGRKLNEICLIAFKYVFPLRWLEPVWYLKERYDYRINTGGARAKLEVHIEDHKPELPSLFRPAPGEAGKRILPWLQLAETLNLFEREANRGTGETERVLVVSDDKGLPQAHYYPDPLIALFDTLPQPLKEVKVLENLIDGITENQLAVVRSRVRSELAAERYRNAAEREALKQKLRESLSAVLKNRENNRRDPIYTRLLDSTGEAIKEVDALR